MPNTIYSTVAYLKDGIDAFGAYVAPVKNFSTKFEQEAIKGNSISVSLYSAGTGSVFTGTYADGASVIGEISVPLTHVYVPLEINVLESDKNAGAELSKLYKTGLQNFAQKVNEVILADVASYTTSASVANAAAFTFTSVKGLAAQLDTLSAPMVDRSLVLKSDFYGALRTDPAATVKLSVTDYDFVGAYPAATLPAAVKGVAFGGISTYAVGAALPKNPLIGSSALIDYQTFTDEVTGIPYQLLVWGDANSGKIKAVFETRVGGKVGVQGSVKIV